MSERRPNPANDAYMLFKRGLNTQWIARTMKMREHDVVKMLDTARSRQKGLPPVQYERPRGRP